MKINNFFNIKGISIALNVKKLPIHLTSDLPLVGMEET